MKKLLKNSLPTTVPQGVFVAVGTGAMVGLYTVTATSLSSVIVAGAVTAGSLCLLTGAFKTMEEEDESI